MKKNHIIIILIIIIIIEGIIIINPLTFFAKLSNEDKIKTYFEFDSTTSKSKDINWLLTPEAQSLSTPPDSDYITRCEVLSVEELNPKDYDWLKECLESKYKDKDEETIKFYFVILNTKYNEYGSTLFDSGISCVVKTMVKIDNEWLINNSTMNAHINKQGKIEITS